MLQFDGGQAQTSDAFPPWPSNIHPNAAPVTPALAVLGPTNQAKGVLFSSYNNLVDIELVYRDRGTSGWGVRYLELNGLYPGSFVFPEAIGFRAKSHNPGGVVQIIGQVWETVDGPLPLSPLSSNATNLSSGGVIIPPTTTVNYQHNDILVASQATLDLVDSGTVTFTVTNDGANNRVKVSAAAGSTPAGTFAQATPGDPVGTGNNTPTMMGLGAGFSFTPARSGKLTMTHYGSMETGSTGSAFAQMYIGTGAAPANGAAPPGGAVVVGGALQMNLTATTIRTPFAMVALAALAVGTTYWFDIAIWRGGASSCTIFGNTQTAVEQV